jgi:hypothetical protein
MDGKDEKLYVAYYIEILLGASVRGRDDNIKMD